MEEKQLGQFEAWFKKMNERFDDTNQKIENRFTALLSVSTNIRNDLEFVKTDLGSVKKDLEFVKGDLGSVKKDLEFVKGDLGSVKKDVQMNKVVIDRIYTEIAELRVELKGSNEKYEARILALELALKELERRVSH